MVAADVARGDMPLSHWDSRESGLLLDVRHLQELAVEKSPEAVNIPLNELRIRLYMLPMGREIHVICRSGQSACCATCILNPNGFNALQTVPGAKYWISVDGII